MRAVGMAMIANFNAVLKSIKPLLMYPLTPLLNPKDSTKMATPTAAAGDDRGYWGPKAGKTMRKIGPNSAAPPIPELLAQNAIRIQVGSINQYLEKSIKSMISENGGDEDSKHVDTCCISGSKWMFVLIGALLAMAVLAETKDACNMSIDCFFSQCLG